MEHRRILLKSGYVIKSPPAGSENHTWRNRYCVLCCKEISNRKKIYFQYYKKEENYERNNFIKEFDLEDCKIAKIPNGIRNYNFVIKLFLTERYDNRELYLCFISKDDMESWYDELNTALKMINERVDRFEPDYKQDPNSPLRQEIERARSKVYDEAYRVSLTEHEEITSKYTKDSGFFDG